MLLMGRRMDHPKKLPLRPLLSVQTDLIGLAGSAQQIEMLGVQIPDPDHLIPIAAHLSAGPDARFRGLLFIRNIGEQKRLDRDELLAGRRHPFIDPDQGGGQILELA